MPPTSAEVLVQPKAAYALHAKSLVALALTAVSMQPAYARAPSPVYVFRGSPVEAPRGFVAMCESDAAFCSRRSGHLAGVASSALRCPIQNSAAGWGTTRHLPSPSDPSCVEVAGTVAVSSMEAHSANMPTAGVVMSTSRVAKNNEPWHTTRHPSARKFDDRREAALLKEVNNLVNSRVHQRADIEVYAQAEHWTRSGIGATAVGDCEDLAIEKRHQLLSRAFDPRRMSFAVVFSPETGLHTVLVVRTERGDMVLDSAYPWIRRADRTPYSWISIQSTDDQMTWLSARV